MINRRLTRFNKVSQILDNFLKPIKSLGRCYYRTSKTRLEESLNQIIDVSGKIISCRERIVLQLLSKTILLDPPLG